MTTFLTMTDVIMEPITLRDAIAIDFFLDHIDKVFEYNEEANNVKTIEVLAASSFHIANIFCAVKEQFNEKIITEEEND